jgi:hypothetical protein
VSTDSESALSATEDAYMSDDSMDFMPAHQARELATAAAVGPHHKSPLTGTIAIAAAAR